MLRTAVFLSIALSTVATAQTNASKPTFVIHRNATADGLRPLLSEPTDAKGVPTRHTQDPNAPACASRLAVRPSAYSTSNATARIAVSEVVLLAVPAFLNAQSTGPATSDVAANQGTQAFARFTPNTALGPLSGDYTALISFGSRSRISSRVSSQGRRSALYQRMLGNIEQRVCCLS